MTHLHQRLAALTATAVFTFALSGAIAVPAWASNFIDVPADHWAETSGVIDRAVALGIIKGTANADGTVSLRPDSPVTRAEAAAMLMRAANVSESAYSSTNETPFTDVAFSDWYTPAINWAYDAGVLNGNNNLARPDDAITREELACMLGNLNTVIGGKPLNGNTSYLDAYPDGGSVSAFARTSVAWAVSAGILGGSSHLLPAASATRAEATKMIVVLADSLDTNEIPGGVIDGSAGGTSTVGTGAVEIALQYEGYPYLYGGASPEEGFDCSGLVMYVYDLLGYDLPHSASAQLAYFRENASRFVTDEDDLQYGDVVFFPGHVAFYVGDGICFGARKPGTPASDCPMYAFGDFLGGGQL